MTYDAYGRIIHHQPVGDLIGTGLVVSANIDLYNAIVNSVEFPGGIGTIVDLNRDGLVNSTDRAIINANMGVGLPRGRMSFAFIDNPIGWKAYHFHPELQIYLARHRWFDPELGRWLQRDPAGYVDGMNLYLYGLGSPFVFVDPMGLFVRQWWNDTCSGVKGLFTGTRNLRPWNESRQLVAENQANINARQVAEEKISQAEADARNAVNQEAIAADAQSDLAVTQARLDAAAAGLALVPGAGWVVLGLEGVNAGIDVSEGNYGSALLRGGGGALGAGANRLLGRAGRQVDDAVRSAPNTGNVAAYQSLDNAGRVNYVGITNNIPHRSIQQAIERGIQIQPIRGLTNLSRMDARGVEQALINHHGLGRNGGTLMNKINSISPSNPIYNSSVQQGNDWLRLIGYPGF